MECGAMYRADGPEALRAVGETEFVNGVAAQSASGIYGNVRACAGIVGHAELQQGAAVVELLEAHIAAGGGRFRGVRRGAAYDPDPQVIGAILQNEPGFYGSGRFREGFAKLAPLGLSFDAFLLEPQLEDLVSLVRAFPSTSIILDHLGAPLGLASYKGRLAERFPIWRKQIFALASLENVSVKVGGLGMVLAGFKSCRAEPPSSSAQLAADWKPYIETCIEAFGVDRCMFESNYPAEVLCGNYHTVWNAFKVVAAGYSPDEKNALFSGTARRIYRLEI
jgi:predicted TIM-barrel fold metal-dependent hydrolase